VAEGALFRAIAGSSKAQQGVEFGPFIAYLDRHIGLTKIIMVQWRSKC
jgi:hypothetical protein